MEFASILSLGHANCFHAICIFCSYNVLIVSHSICISGFMV